MQDKNPNVTVQCSLCGTDLDLCAYMYEDPFEKTGYNIFVWTKCPLCHAKSYIPHLDINWYRDIPQEMSDGRL